MSMKMKASAAEMCIRDSGKNDFQRPFKMAYAVIRRHILFQKLPVHGQNFRHQEGAVLSRPVGQRLGPGKQDVYKRQEDGVSEAPHCRWRPPLPRISYTRHR